MQSVPLVSGSVLRPLLDYLAQGNGGDGLVGYAVEPVVRSRSSLLPFFTGGVVFARAADALGAPEIGLQVGETSPLEAIGEFGELLAASPTLGAALALGVQQSSRYNTGARVWLTIRGEDAWFHRSFVRSFRVGRQQVSDYGLRLWLRLIQLAAGPDWRPGELRLEGPPPAHAERLRALAHRVSFREPFTAIVFPRALLALRMPSRVRAPSSRGPNGERTAPATDVAGSLRQTLEALVEMGEANLPAAAAAVGTSVRSLQRRLRAVGGTFQGLLDQARCRVALELLCDDARKVIDVGVQLGYTDAANFTRAFRRWTGVSPQAFRRVSRELRASASR